MPSPLKHKSDEAATTIPDRLYFKIGDVARICGVEAYVLRFWESQFPQLKPNKSGTGQRLYRRRDVELILEIKSLVHGHGYTLAGARQALGQRPPASRIALVTGSEASPASMSVAVQRVRTELRAIAAMLSEPGPRPPQARRRTRFAVASGELFPG